VEFLINIEGININFTDVNIEPDRVNTISVLLSKKLYLLLDSLFQASAEMAENSQISILWVATESINSEMSDEDIANNLAKAIVKAVMIQI
jgi:hypothetical protein